MVNLDYLYNPEASKPLFSKNHFVDEKLGFSIIENGTMLPYKKTIDGKTSPDGWGFGGIVDSKGEFIRDSFVADNVGQIYTPSPESIQHSSETVIYLGMFHSTWGHAITDNIKRLWFLKSEFMNQFKDCPLVYLICTKRTKFSLESYKDFRRLLEILEVDVDRLRLITEPTQFENIIIPDASFKGYELKKIKFTREYREMIEHIKNFALKNRTPIANKKLYFYHGMRQFGEERLADYFKSKGYEIITFEKQTAGLDYELNLLINAESFASALGSCSINSLFLRDGTETIIIPRSTMVVPDGYQMLVNEVNSLNTIYIATSLSVLGHNDGAGPYYYIISPQLKKFFGDKWDGYQEEEFKTFLQYVKYSMSWGRGSFKGNVKSYCGDIFSDFMAQLKQRKDLIKACDMPSDWDTFRPMMIYQTYIKPNSQSWKNENQSSNPLDQKIELRAIRINYPSHKVYYSVYWGDKEGWSAEALSPEWTGVGAGPSRPIYGMRVRLDEAGAKEFNILYRMHTFDDTWTPWAKNGETLYSYGQKLNAIQIKLEPVNSQSDQTQTEKLNYQTFLLKSNEIYLQGQRQDLTQIKLI